MSDTDTPAETAQELYFRRSMALEMALKIHGQAQSPETVVETATLFLAFMSGKTNVTTAAE